MNYKLGKIPKALSLSEAVNMGGMDLISVMIDLENNLAILNTMLSVT